MVFIAVVNHSTRVHDADVQLAARACAAQVRLHVAPEWGMYTTREAPVPPGDYVIGIFDDSD